MTTKELKTNQTYQIKFYEEYHCIQSLATKSVIEHYLDKGYRVEVYDYMNHYEMVRRDTK